MAALLLNVLSIRASKSTSLSGSDKFRLKKDEKGTVICLRGKRNVNTRALPSEIPRTAVSTDNLVSPSMSTKSMPKGIGMDKFFSGKTILVSGGTGFFAKALIEKILRTMPDVGKIYLLIKAQNQEAAKERLKREVISSDIFKCLQQKYGKSYQRFMLSKLVPVVGNVCESDLGLEGDIADLIAKEVEVIVNSAANTTFDERYDVSLDTKGAKNMVTFAKRCEEIKLLLQVSTGNNVYRPLMNLLQKSEMMENLDIFIEQGS